MPDRPRRTNLAYRLVLAAALCASGLVAQAQTAPTDCPPVATLPSPDEVQRLLRGARDHGFLWRVTKDDHASWLYGTIHVARLEWAFPGPETLRALHAVDTIALEIDPLDPQVRQQLAQGLAALRRPAMPEELASRLSHARQADCLPAAALEGAPPEAQVMALSSLVGRRDGIDPAYGIDSFLATIGHTQQIEVVSLETPELQMRAIAMPSEAQSLAWIDASLREIEDGTARTQLARLAQVWADGDFTALSGYTSWCDCERSEVEQALMQRVLGDRNPGLAQAIDALHAAGKRVFAAVGSLHMIGAEGLPALLAARGYRVERVFDAQTGTSAQAPPGMQNRIGTGDAAAAADAPGHRTEKPGDPP